VNFNEVVTSAVRHCLGPDCAGLNGDARWFFAVFGSKGPRRGGDDISGGEVSSVRCQSIAGVEKVTGVVVARIAVPKPSGVLAMIYSSTPGRARYGIARLAPLRAGESRTFHLSVAKTGSGKSSRGCFVEWGPGTRFNSFPAAPPGQLGSSEDHVLHGMRQLADTAQRGPSPERLTDPIRRAGVGQEAAISVE